MTTTKPRPTLATTEPLIWQWATDRGLINADGTLNKATPAAQCSKTTEEIGEALQIDEAWMRVRDTTGKYIPSELWEWLDANLPPKEIKKLTDGVINQDCSQLVKNLATMLATEFGDILVTLSLLARVHGSSLEECADVHYFRAHKYFELDYAARFINQPLTWQFVGWWRDELAVAIGDKTSVLPIIGGLSRCVADAALTKLAMSPDECLALAYDKISSRTGKMVDGTFVKDN